MKKEYLVPEMKVIPIRLRTSLLQVSNGENLNMTTYGSRGVGDDDTDGFWDD